MTRWLLSSSIFLAACISAPRILPPPPITVCFDSTLTERDIKSALEGISFWKVPFQVVPVPIPSPNIVASILQCNVRISREVRKPHKYPLTPGYVVGSHDSILVSGDVMCVTRHEFGHILKYPDTDLKYGVMAEHACIGDFP
jgi:hypothetical protein